MTDEVKLPPGWYYYNAEYPDEGLEGGPFNTRQQAEHAAAERNSRNLSEGQVVSYGLFEVKP